MLALTITFVVAFVPYFFLSIVPIHPLSLLDNALYLNLFWIGHLFLNVNSTASGWCYSVYGVVGLALVVGAYFHILYRVKQQSLRKRDRIANGVGPTDPATLAASSIVEERCDVTSQSDVVNDEAEDGGSHDNKNRYELKECDQKVIYSSCSEEEKSRNVLQPSGRRLSPKTTVVMFVLTIDEYGKEEKWSSASERNGATVSVHFHQKPTTLQSEVGVAEAVDERVDDTDETGEVTADTA
ncbi:hypothetical protein C0Q70_12918 [Pomacea canaliculata]|uniref:Uncharacterized protein n=1 Tax=Pomacea canaliculata TaxID=400727 RepID=A0A2T7P2W0_POMCA|nr:hypothetical protein C0Q70_12918 [Pomacea canaliculata]